MNHYLKEELLEVLPTSIKESKELSTKQKIVLGQLIIYNGLDKTKVDGYFYRSNKDLCTDCDIQEKTLITAVIKLESLGLIKRKKGDRKSGASEYRLNMDAINNYCKTEIEDNSNNNDYSNDYSKQITAIHEKINELEITVKKLIDRITVIEGKNYSTDTESDIDKEKDKDKVIYNNNIINKENFEKIENKEKTEEVKVKEDEIKKEVEIKEKSNKEVEQSQVEIEDSEKEKLNEFQLPFEVLVSTDELDNINEHNTNDEEQYQALIKYLQPQLDLLEGVKRQEQFNYVKNTIAKEGQKYIDTHEDDINSSVVERVNKTIGTALKKKKEELSVMDLHEYLKMQHQYVL